MKSINYLGKRYQQFIDDMAQDRKGEQDILVALNGASRSDLSAVISDISRATNKTVFATTGDIDKESELSKNFTEAHKNQEILLLDEADALFEKRSEVKDSHDRYANIEINSLLENIENHDGIVILASCERKNMDSSLLSKVNVLIKFPPF